MKSLPPITEQRRLVRGEARPPKSRRNHPIVDSHYHAGGTGLRGRNGTLKLASPSFRELSSHFLGAEMKRDYVAEAFLFAIIVGVSTWPIVTMMRALGELVK